jgi:hypothetical protein
MAYYTEFKIETQPVAAAASVRKSIEFELDYDPFDGDEVKWYEVAETVAVVSAKHPGVLITILGQGQTPGDEWIIHAHGGEIERHKRAAWVPPPASNRMLAARAKAESSAPRPVE